MNSQQCSLSYIDTHAHLTSEQILPHLSSVLTRAAQAHVQTIVNICTDEASLQAGMSLYLDVPLFLPHQAHSGGQLQRRPPSTTLLGSAASDAPAGSLHLPCQNEPDEAKKVEHRDYSQFPQVFHAAATTPHDVEKEGESFFPFVEEAAINKKLIAIGETGLDYFYEHSKKAVQQAFLSRYFALARSVQLPLIFHCRDAFLDLFAMADQEYKGLPALLHCFTGTLEEAKAVLDRGWVLSLSGIVTFKKSEALREVVKYVPLDRLVIETDSPYLTPQSHRGKQNEPSFLPEVASLIALVKGLSVIDVAAATTLNAQRFFSLSKVL